MDLYIKISFWSCVISIIGRALFLSFSEYPRKNSTSRLGDMIGLSVGIGFAIWSGKLLGWV